MESEGECSRGRSRERQLQLNDRNDVRLAYRLIPHLQEQIEKARHIYTQVVRNDIWVCVAFRELCKDLKGMNARSWLCTLVKTSDPCEDVPTVNVHPHVQANQKSRLSDGYRRLLGTIGLDIDFTDGGDYVHYIPVLHPSLAP